MYNKLNLTNIQSSDNILKRACEIRKYNIKNMDSLHIACAESSNIDYFITTGRLLINASSRADLKVKVIKMFDTVEQDSDKSSIYLRIC